MNEDAKEMMTNRQLLTLCAKGVVEWRTQEDDTVRHTYEYKDGTENEPIADNIIVRPLSKGIAKSDNELEWYFATKDAFNQLIFWQRLRHLAGG